MPRADPTPPSPERLDAVFDALSHGARREILVVLHVRGGSMSAGEIADRFRHAWPTTTRHLGVLHKAGLVESTRRGRNRLYQLRPGPLAEATGWLASWVGQAVASEGRGERPAWASLPYAAMRNTIPPGSSEPGPG